MEYIYTRVSTDKQTTDNQTTELHRRFPDALQITETASGAKHRPELERLIDGLKAGDTLIVAALDRLGRKTSEVLTLLESLHSKGINVVSIREGLDYSTVTGRLVSQIMVSVAEMERGLISERTKAALASRKAKGLCVGRKPSIDPAVKDHARALREQGLSLRDIARLLNISHSTVQLALKAA